MLNTNSMLMSPQLSMLQPPIPAYNCRLEPTMERQQQQKKKKKKKKRESRTYQRRDTRTGPHHSSMEAGLSFHQHAKSFLLTKSSPILPTSTSRGRKKKKKREQKLLLPSPPPFLLLLLLSPPHYYSCSWSAVNQMLQ
jgi:hypothetical protein